MQLLTEATDSDHLRSSLALPMLALLEADQYHSMVWNGPANRFERPTAMNVSPDCLRRWDDYYRLIDPLTAPMLARRRPTIATEVMPYSELARTEFFHDFLQPEQMHWGINIYFFDRDTCVGDFRIWRKRERSNFDATAVDILRMIEPAVTTALSRLSHRQIEAGTCRPSEAEPAEEVLQRMGGLSQREAEVAWLVASGYADKEIARHLHVQFVTVRYHLANAFRKLKASNRAALAARVQVLVDARHG